MQRTLVNYVLLVVRGMAMGAADIIPGVSGGTVAFITGIYEELVNSIKSINLSLFKTLFNKGIAAAWKQVNGNFLISVVAGIFISLFTLARVLSWLLSNHQMLVWAVFFGLIVGSAIFVGKTINKWGSTTILALVGGTLVAFYITIATPASTPDGLFFIFLSGSIAICAMILPGISGAFILLLLGKYQYMLTAVKNLQVIDLAVFAAGCVIGVIAFSNVISWLFRKYRDATLSLLTGFMIGSLNKLWPWKQILVTGINSKGEEIPLIEKSILPGQYHNITGESPMILAVVLFAIIGLVLVLGFDHIASRKKSIEK
jgi:putative membrane protein